MPPKRPNRPGDPIASGQRTDDNAYLYNEDLFGLNPKLDFRTRLIIGCYVTDSVTPELVRQSFATARIFPPSATELIKKDVSARDGGLARRQSSRLNKDAAAKAIEDLGQRAKFMSSGQVIQEAVSIVDNALRSDRYCLRPMEELTGNKKKKDKADPGKKPSAPPPAYKRTIGYFSPASLQAVSDSLNHEDEHYKGTHLFVCRCVCVAHSSLLSLTL
jgi:hypothetical protein